MNRTTIFGGIAIVALSLTMSCRSATTTVTGNAPSSYGTATTTNTETTAPVNNIGIVSTYGSNMPAYGGSAPGLTDSTAYGMASSSVKTTAAAENTSEQVPISHATKVDHRHRAMRKD